MKLLNRELLSSNFTCSECNRDVARVMQFEDTGDYVELCPACLFKALAMFESCAQCEHLDINRGTNGQCITQDEKGPAFVTICSGYNHAEMQCFYKPSRFKLKVVKDA